jgi:aminobenzoyl-glutamate transport protein
MSGAENTVPPPEAGSASPPPERQRGFLGFVERAGNLLPEPTMIFVYLIAALMVLSALGDALGWSASLPFSGEEAPEGATLADGSITYEATG